MKKNILIIITKLSDGGAEKNVAFLADRLSKEHNVMIATFDNSYQHYKTNVKIIDLKTPKSNNIIKKIYQTFIRLNKIKQIKEKYEIDCSISFLTVPNLINALTKKNDKVIISIRNYISMYNCKILFYIANKIACNKADKIVCVSNSVKKDQIETYKVNEAKLITIYNSCIMQNEKINFNKKYESDIITIGRLNNQKGQWHLIKAFKKLVEKHPNTKMIILGSGKLHRELNKIIEENMLQKNVRIENFLSNPQDYLANSKIFVLPSVYEGLPNAILEAMSLGLPIIATDCFGGNREILHPKLKDEKHITEPIEGEFGILIPNMGFVKQKKMTKNEDYLANYLIKLIENNDLKNKYIQKSKERISFFSEEKNLNLWRKII